MTQNSLLKQGCELKFQPCPIRVFEPVFEPDTGFQKYKCTSKGPYKKPISGQKYWSLRDWKKKQLLTCSKHRLSLQYFFSFSHLRIRNLDLIMGARWWQSPSLQYGSAYQAVTLTINLKQLYQVTFNVKGLSHENETHKS